MNCIQTDAAELIEIIFQDYKTHPIDLLGMDDSIGEFNYISNHKQYFERPIFEINELFKQRGKPQIKILELGSYLAFVSITLSKMGYKMRGADLDIFK